MIDYRTLLDSELEKYKAAIPGNTLGQAVFSALTVLTKGDFTKETLLTCSDEDLYSVINIAMRRDRVEENDNFTEDELVFLGEKFTVEAEELKNNK